MAKIAFFGTPEFAVPSLLALHDFCKKNNHSLEVVVTQPDKKQGRNQHVESPMVKKAAQSLNIPVLQPETLRKDTTQGDNFFSEFKRLNIDLAVVVAYGKIITKRLLDSAPLGFLNIHGSILPKLRGAAPIQRAIMEGFSETGVCLMQMNIKLDEGDVYCCQKTIILPNDTSFTLARRLSNIGAKLLCSNLEKIISKKLQSTPQEHDKSTYAHMLTKDEGLLDFNNPGKNIHNKVRAYDPWPGSYAFYNNKRIKFFHSFFLKSSLKKDFSPGQIVSIKPYLGIKTLDGIIFFRSIQMEGKKILPVKDALLGIKIDIGMKFN